MKYLSSLLLSAAVFLLVPSVSEGSDGSIVAWGDNSYGQCNVPAPNEGFVVIAGGYYHSLGLHAYLHVIEPDSSTIWTQYETDLPVGWSGEFTVPPPVPIGDDEYAANCNYALHSAVPNPSYGTALVAFEIPEIVDVCITVYDISGRAVTELMYSALTQGMHEAVISDLHAGLYVVRMQAGDFIDSGRMIVIR